MNLICVLVRVPIFYDNPFSFSSYAECFRLMKVIKSPYTTAPASGGFSFIYWKTFRVCSFLFFSYSPSMNSPFLKSAFPSRFPLPKPGTCRVGCSFSHPGRFQGGTGAARTPAIRFPWLRRRGRTTALSTSPWIMTTSLNFPL